MTASHVVIDQKTHIPDTAIIVKLPDGTAPLAILKTPANAFFISHDIAILKVDRTGLPHLELGDENESDIGSSVAIIGFPFSAGVSTRFCLTATVAAIEIFRFQSGNVNAVYFQGPSVKGVSGSPVISLGSGKVIGIVTLKLTGISGDLQREGEQISNSGQGGVAIDGVMVKDTLGELIATLDGQLANGLGAASGANDAAYALKKTQANATKNSPPPSQGGGSRK